MKWVEILAFESLVAVMAGVESDGNLYVAANHWPRTGYPRAVENPDVAVTRDREKAARRAVSVTGPELDRITRG